MPSIYCCVKGCWKSGKSKHRFPNPSKHNLLFHQWVSLCGNKRLVTEMTAEKIYKNCRVCSEHFILEDFGPNQTLKKGVLPALKLPEPLPLPEETDEKVVLSDVSVPSTSTQNPIFLPFSDNKNKIKIEPSDVEATDSNNEQFTTPTRRSTLLSEDEIKAELLDE